MNEVEIFDFKGNDVRTLLIEGEPWFIGKDVADILGYSRTAKAIQDHVEDEDKDAVPIQDSIGRKQATSIINESGLYGLILSSKLPAAKEFKHWVTHEVLPSIRKNGAYLTAEKAEEILLNPDTIIALAQQVKKERTGRLIAEQTIGELQPKADYCDTILESKGAVATSVIAKDYGLTPQSLNKILHDEHVQYKSGETWLLYQNLVDLGYTKSNTFYDNNGWAHVQTKWTQKGRLMINDLLKKKDILPLMDRK